MKKINVDLAIIGGGPAGLAAAAEAKKQGINQVMIIERDVALGGILQQCIHDGFGIHRFKERLSGGQYAQRFITALESENIDVRLNTTVIKITKSKDLYVVSQDRGMEVIGCQAIILAMGCRERTRNQVLISGHRPSGILTAGTVQRYINLEGYLPGKKSVILGSGDIGLIMARRMVLEGMKVEGVYELMKNPGGLSRNIVQCLDDYNIPLHLSTTVTSAQGDKRLEAVRVAQVDENLNPIQATEKQVECDLLVLAVGLIPENELSHQLGIQIDPVTGGPMIDENFMTSQPGIFAAGNVVAVFDLVDYVSATAEIAARGAAAFIKEELDPHTEYVDLSPGHHIHYVLPQKVRKENVKNDVPIYLRVQKPLGKARLICSHSSGNEIFQVKKTFVAPPEMIHLTIPLALEKFCYPFGLNVRMEEIL